MSSAEELAVGTDVEQHVASDDGATASTDYCNVVVERLKSLVSEKSAVVTDDITKEIQELLITRLPESACGEEDVIAPIRANLWSAMLLGLRPEDLDR